MQKAFVVGVAGGSGSGKTTLVRQLVELIGSDQVSVLHHDAYYLNQDQMPKAVREIPNWDHPEALDNPLFLEHLAALVAGKPINRPVYDFATHSRMNKTVTVRPTRVLIAEGILLLAIEAIRKRIDLRVFIDTPADIRFLRRLRRDTQERGRTPDFVCHQHETTVRPMYQTYVEPSRHHAHLIVPFLERNAPAIDVLASWIRAVLRAGTSEK